MKKLRLGILDWEVSYAIHFMEYINARSQYRINAEVFTNEDELKVYLNKNELDILLVYADGWSADKSTELNIEAIERIVLLSEGDVDASLSDLSAIYKYQPPQTILHEIMKMYVDHSENDRVVVSKKAKLFGIYSPIKYMDLNVIALLIARAAGMGEKTLYLNLQAFSEIRTYFQQSDTGCITDFLYYVNNNAEGLPYLLGSMVREVEGVLTICPPQSYLDVQDVPFSLWQRMLEFFQNQSSYENIVIQLDESVSGFSGILDSCDKVYIPVLQDIILPEEKEWERFLEITDQKDLQEKMSLLRLPICSEKDRLRRLSERIANTKYSQYIEFIDGKGEEYG